jgi:hypothetical protein
MSGTVQATFELLTYVARTTLHNSVDGRQSGGGGSGMPLVAGGGVPTAADWRSVAVSVGGGPAAKAAPVSDAAASVSDGEQQRQDAAAMADFDAFMRLAAAGKGAAAPIKEQAFEL